MSRIKKRKNIAARRADVHSDGELNMFWTNLGNSDEDMIALYHAHGECEQFHSEIKTDIGVERLPSGKFDTNELGLELTVLAYNILRMIGMKRFVKAMLPQNELSQDNGFAPSYKILFILPVMLRSTQGNCFFPSVAATPGLTVFLLLQSSFVALDFHRFRKSAEIFIPDHARQVI